MKQKHETFGDYFKSLIKSRGLTPIELAKKSGVSLDLIYKIQRNERSLSPDTAVKISDYVRVTSIDLLCKQIKYNHKDFK